VIRLCQKKGNLGKGRDAGAIRHERSHGGGSTAPGGSFPDEKYS
jgi:hypothetical protein